MTYKLMILIALSSASRASALHHLDIPYIVRTPHKYIFNFQKLHRNWRKGAPPPQIAVQEYPKETEKELCFLSH